MPSVAEPIEPLQGEWAGSPLKPIHGTTRVAMQDMIGGVMCPLGASTTQNGQD